MVPSYRRSIEQIWQGQEVRWLTSLNLMRLSYNLNRHRIRIYTLEVLSKWPSNFILKVFQVSPNCSNLHPYSSQIRSYIFWFEKLLSMKVGGISKMRLNELFWNAFDFEISDWKSWTPPIHTKAWMAMAFKACILKFGDVLALFEKGFMLPHVAMQSSYWICSLPY